MTVACRDGGATLTSRYQLEASTPIRPADQCEELKKRQHTDMSPSPALPLQRRRTNFNKERTTLERKTIVIDIKLFLMLLYGLNKYSLFQRRKR